ncbi:MAG: SAM-dependent methyltransferase [Rhodospirillales bacterium]|nr:SAM-dependent methyltransferase [Rhodospirillales bacterium]
MSEPNSDIAAGRLSLVSVGVGDVDNITVKALKTIEAADVVLGMKFLLKQYEELLQDKEIHDSGHGYFLGVAPAHGPRPPTPQQELDIIQLVRSAVATGKNVVVLDFGDPTIYSPQAGYLSEFSDLSPDVVPGISSVNAANAVLRRELSGAFDRPIIITHAMDHAESDDRLEALAATGATLVFFTMGMDLNNVIERLRSRLPGDTPAVIVAKAGFDRDQDMLSATLDSITEKANGASKTWAHLLYVGDALR